MRGQVQAWVAEVEEATWRDPHDVRERHASASFVGDRRVVFNLKGNRYRLGVQISYEAQVVAVLRIGTHAEYDGWDW
ncbi:type II toxin-antitoxin system HigB family toxin [Candidatus Palauibacter sp.]|uniref:type II toxin-antitoxin system HigB family toxin n=1 Tax=Candidatus Palauibacter sp. TaxID=3101350 RepID=UPI003B594B5A